MVYQLLSFWRVGFSFHWYFLFVSLHINCPYSGSSCSPELYVLGGSLLWVVWAFVLVGTTTAEVPEGVTLPDPVDCQALSNEETASCKQKKAISRTNNVEIGFQKGVFQHQCTHGTPSSHAWLSPASLSPEWLEFPPASLGSSQDQQECLTQALSNCCFCPASQSMWEFVCTL